MADRLYGGEGNDRLNGGTANDLLSGGLGNDVFIFDTSAGTDHISDFQNGLDRLEFHGISTASVKVSAVGADTVIHFGIKTIILDNISAALIKAGDFTFT